MRQIRYTAEELKIIKDSPLCKKPDGLPAIDQWFEIAAQPQKSTRSAAQRGDESELLGRRPGLFEQRQRSGHSGAGDDFLGPRSSFATLSAARQSKGQSIDGDNEVLRNRTNRDGERGDRPERGDRTREKDSTRRFDTHGTNDEDRSTRYKSRMREEEGEPRRTGFNRDQPWVREGAGTKDTDRNWRESRTRKDLPWEDIGRGQEASQDVPWALPSKEDRNRAPTADDMKAFMQKMRQADSSETPDNKERPTSAEYDFGKPEPKPQSQSQPQQDGGVNLSGNVFGVWGELPPKQEANVEPEQPASTSASAKAAAAAAKASKKSRFFPGAPPGGAGVNAPPAVQSPAEEVPPPHSPQPPSKNPDDVEGFNRILAMLSMKSNTPKEISQAIASPPPAGPMQRPPTEPPRNGHHSREPTSPRQPMNTSASVPPQSEIHHKGPPGLAGSSSNSQVPRLPPHSQNPSRDSEFLMNLMRGSAQPAMSRTPFNETQIYGQVYGRPPPPQDMPPMMNNFSPPPLQGPARGPPPGMFSRGEHSYGGEPDMPRQSMRSPDDFRGMPEPPPFMHPDNMHPPPGMPPFDEQVSSRRPPGLGLPSGITPPPGFLGRGQPNFPNFPPGHPGHPPPHPGMRPPMQPPGFFNGPPGLGSQPGRGPAGPGPGPSGPEGGRPPSGQYPGLPPMPYMMQHQQPPPPPQQGQAMTGPPRR